MRAKITESEKKVYEYIKRSLQEGYAPSVREICSGCGFKSTSTAHRAIKSLTEKGYLEKHDNLNRAIKLAGQRVEKLPLIESSEDLEAIDRVDTFIDFNPGREHSGLLFAVTADNDIPASSVKAGDIIVAEKDSPSAQDDLAVITENGRLRVKLVGAAENGIIGKAVGVIRYLR